MRLNLDSYILPDKDVDSFIRPIFLQFQQDLENDAYSMFVDALGLPNERHDASGHVILSRSKRDAYNDFVQCLMSNIRSRDFDSSITADATAIKDGLGEQEIENIDRHILRSQKQEARPKIEAEPLKRPRLAKPRGFSV